MSIIRQIIEAYFKGTYPKSVRRKFAMWLKDEQNKEEKDEILTELWNKPDIEDSRSTEKSFQELKFRIFPQIKQNDRISFVSSSFVRTWLKIAAMLLLPLLSATFTYFYLKKDIPVGDMRLVECIVPNGQIKTVILPDSSIVQLNVGSTLIYPEHFGKTRTVYLNGEAYIKVVRNEKQPFTVNTTDMEVEVLGTVFNVASYTDDEHSSITLESGKVNVRLKNAGDRMVLLAPNEQIFFNRKSGLVEKQTVRVNTVTAWINGNLAIQSMSIDEIAKTIKRKYGIEVYLNSHRYKDERITMKLGKEENINELMNILKYLIPGMQYKIENDKLYIY